MYSQTCKPREKPVKPQKNTHAIYGGEVAQRGQAPPPDGLRFLALSRCAYRKWSERNPATKSMASEPRLTSSSGAGVGAASPHHRWARVVNSKGCRIDGTGGGRFRTRPHSRAALVEPQIGSPPSPLAGDARVFAVFLFVPVMEVGSPSTPSRARSNNSMLRLLPFKNPIFVRSCPVETERFWRRNGLPFL